MSEQAAGRRIPRRWFLGTAGLAATAGAGAYLYSLAPSFWRRYVNEWGREIRAPRHTPDPRSWPDRGLHAAWLGHATVLLKIDGFTILTDPVLSTYAGIGLGIVTLGVKRLVAPAMPSRHLPPVDLVLLSHAHMDHFDIPTLRALESPDVSVITAHKTSDLLRPERYSVVRELRWDERTRIGPVEVRALEVKHWGARLRNDRWRGYNGYTIEAGRYRLIFAGDTALTPSFARLRTARPFDLTIMPIGAYNPYIRNHCSPEQAWQMGNEAGAEHFIPIHHGTFQLSREPVGEPIERFLTAAANHPDRVAIHEIGQTWQVS